MAIAKDADGWVEAFAKNGMHPIGEEPKKSFLESWEAVIKQTTLNTKKPSKYRNKKTVVDGREFHSKKESGVYLDLKNEQIAGLITELECQVKIPIYVNGIHICDYIADFGCKRHGKPEIIEVKSKITRKLPVYIIKKKLLQAMGIRIREIC